MAQQPHGAAFGHAPGIEEQRDLGVQGDAAPERVDLAPDVGEAEDLARRQERPGHVGHRRSGVLGHSVIERDPRQVDHVVDDARRHDLAAETVRPDRVGKPLAQLDGEVLEQVGFERELVREVGLEELGDIGVLRVGDHHRELRGPQTAAYALPFGDLLVGRQELECRGRGARRLRACRDTERAR